jgi:hypothetical protein
VGGSVGGGVALIGLSVLYFRFARGSKHSSSSELITEEKALSSFGGTNSAASNSNNNHSNQLAYATEISVERQDDVSTLGDPFGGMALSSNPDERTASVGADYDYKHFLGAGTMVGRDRLASSEESDLSSSIHKSNSELSSSNVSKSLVGGHHHHHHHPNHPLGHSVFADDSSFEEQYDVAAGDGATKTFRVDVPPGKLGMVIDTPNGGVPVVHAIKPESVLCNRVAVGDQLIAVDHEDVSSMTAVQVSKLISLKSDSKRILVFVRSRKRIDSADDSELLLEVDEGAC